jgi:hypothetical protein
MMIQRSVFLFAMVAGCAASPAVPPVRFANAPAVQVVNDRRDVPAKPSERKFIHSLYHYDGILHRRVVRALELPRPRRALGVNALDEVPDSTWFTNRIGARELTLDELRTGPAQVGSPEPHKPWVVRSLRTGASELSLMISDARGKKFMLKFDDPDVPEQKTAAHVITGKLLWACGFNVTEDHVVYVRPSELTLGDGAVISDVFGDKRPLDRAELERQLATVHGEADGRHRAMASLWLDGQPLGGHPAEGVRDDDPNDRIPHQLRRDLRGMYAILAWIDHVDIQESNFIDMWVSDAGRHYVKHYLLDFGKSLGVMETTGQNPRHGHEYVVDIAVMLRELFTLGLNRRPWESRTPAPVRGLGMFSAADFDPGAWKPNSPAYVPFLVADRLDKFWGAKILIRFTRAQIRAAVEAGRLTDPRAVEYLTDVLVARQRATARYWFERVDPLDRFELATGQAGAALCFDDLALAYQLMPGPARYRITAYDGDGRALGPASTVASGAAGRTCTGPLPLAGGYAIVEIEATRGGGSGRTYVHLGADPATHAPQVIGIWRP